MTALAALEMVPDARASGLSTGEVSWLFLLGSGVALATLLVVRRVFSAHSHLARTALVVALVIGLHNIPEGSITVTVAMLSLDAAVLSMVVIALQNIPEALYDAARIVMADPGFQQGGQRPVGRGDGGGCGSFGHGVGGGVRAQIETQIDAVGAPHGQLQGVQAGRCVQAAHGVLDSVRVGAGHHEPQIVGVLALVVVVDARVL